jgi:hypothetical protein
MLDVSAMLLYRAGTDQLYLTASQHGYQHSSCIHWIVIMPATDNPMKMIYEQNERAYSFVDCHTHCPQAFIGYDWRNPLPWFWPQKSFLNQQLPILLWLLPDGEPELCPDNDTQLSKPGDLSQRASWPASFLACCVPPAAAHNKGKREVGAQPQTPGQGLPPLTIPLMARCQTCVSLSGFASGLPPLTCRTDPIQPFWPC